MMTWSNVLCAVDFTEGAHAALEDAAELARRFHADLTLVHALDLPHAAGARGSPVLPERLEEEATELRRKLDSWKAEAERRSGRPVRAVIESGPAAAEIVKVARDGHFDVVVTGTHGRTGLRRALLGSVAERVVREAPCPVLVARPPPDEGD